MISFQYKVQDRAGIHARPASQLIQYTSKLDSGIRIVYNGKEADGKKIMPVISLGVKYGETIEIQIFGDQEIKESAELKKFVQENF